MHFAPIRYPVTTLLRAAAFVISIAPAIAHAQGAEIFRDADLKLGEKLIAEHKCAQCHAQRVGGNGSAIYRPTGRVNSVGRLRGTVQQCSTQLNLQLFPEELDAIAAVLNRDYYKFK
jgi:hypothetical protein